LLQLAFLHCTTILLIGVFPALLLFVFLNALSPMKWVTFVLPVIWLCAVGEGARSAVCLSFKAWRDLVRFKQNPPRIL
jgi:hypothetical protein